MKEKGHACRHAGFTLMELLLGVTLSVMIFLAAGSMLALLFRTDIKTKRIESLEQTKNDLSSEFTTTIRWAENVIFANGQLIAGSDIYKLEGGRILKNNDPLTPADISITSFTAQNYSNTNEVKSYEIIVEMENKNFSSIKDNAKIVVSQRKTLFENQ